LRVGSRQDYGCGGVDQRIATLERGIDAPWFERVCLEQLQLPGIPLLEHVEMRTFGVVTEVAHGRVDGIAVVEKVDNDVARDEPCCSCYADASHCCLPVPEVMGVIITYKRLGCSMTLATKFSIIQVLS